MARQEGQQESVVAAAELTVLEGQSIFGRVYAELRLAVKAQVFGLLVAAQQESDRAYIAELLASIGESETLLALGRDSSELGEWEDRAHEEDANAAALSWGTFAAVILNARELLKSATRMEERRRSVLAGQIMNPEAPDLTGLFANMDRAGLSAAESAVVLVSRGGLPKEARYPIAGKVGEGQRPISRRIDGRGVGSLAEIEARAIRGVREN